MKFHLFCLFSHVEESSSSTFDCIHTYNGSLDPMNNIEDEEEELGENNDSEEGDSNGNSESQESEGSDIMNNDGDDKEESSLTYHEKLIMAKDCVILLTGDTVTTTSGKKSIIWTIIEQNVCEAQERER